MLPVRDYLGGPPLFWLVQFLQALMEFVTIGLLMAGFDPVNAFMLTLFVNGRHFFYGLSALQRYVNMGWKWFPTVAWICDEALQLMYLRSCPMMWMKNGSTSMYRGLIIPFGW